MRYRKFFEHAWGKIVQSANYSESAHILFGIYTFIAFPLYFWVWYIIEPQPYQVPTLRIIATLFGLIIAVKLFWPKTLKPLFPVVWHLGVLYCVPFFFTFMTLNNQGSVAWLLNTMTALFLVIILYRWVSIIIISCSGIFLGWLAYYLATENPEVHLNLTLLALTYIPIIIAALIMLNKKDSSMQLKLDAVKMFGSSVAHELRTPLASIRTAVAGLRKYLPLYMKAYDVAIASDDSIEKIPKRKQKNLSNALQRIDNELNFANVTIDTILLNVNSENVINARHEVVSIHECLEEVFERYPFKDQERELIHANLNTKDFKFKGSKELTIHLFYNLLNNAFYFIAAEKKGEIYIYLEENNRFNEVHFKDTAKGMPKSVQANIFKFFYSERETGTGVGLAFCKMVMQSYDGDIICISKENEFTEFVLMFPKISDDEGKLQF